MNEFWCSSLSYKCWRQKRKREGCTTLRARSAKGNIMILTYGRSFPERKEVIFINPMVVHIYLNPQRTMKDLTKRKISQLLAFVWHWPISRGRNVNNLLDYWSLYHRKKKKEFLLLIQYDWFISIKNDTKSILFDHHVAVIVKRSLQYHPSLLRPSDPGMIPGTKQAEPILDL